MLPLFESKDHTHWTKFTLFLMTKTCVLKKGSVQCALNSVFQYSYFKNQCISLSTQVVERSVVFAAWQNTFPIPYPLKWARMLTKDGKQWIFVMARQRLETYPQTQQQLGGPHPLTEDTLCFVAASKEISEPCIHTKFIVLKQVLQNECF